MSASWGIPIIYTFHTRYDLYGHYVVQDSEVLRRLVRSLATGYCNMCDAVIAPSASIAYYLHGNGVSAPVSVIPTGVDTALLASGDAVRGRLAAAIPRDVPVVGHVGRLAQEKNLEFLAGAIAACLRQAPERHALIVGDGPMRGVMQDVFDRSGVAPRVCFTGVLTGDALCDAYAAMDVFAFSSFSETQGLVLAEAMASGTPVVALDAPGVREVVDDARNGRLLAPAVETGAFAGALAELLDLDSAARTHFAAAAKETAEQFSMDRSHDRIVALYQSARNQELQGKVSDDSAWRVAKRSIERELDIIGNIAHAVGAAVLVPSGTDNG